SMQAKVYPIRGRFCKLALRTGTCHRQGRQHAYVIYKHGALSSTRAFAYQALPMFPEKWLASGKTTQGLASLFVSFVGVVSLAGAAGVFLGSKLCACFLMFSA